MFSFRRLVSLAALLTGAFACSATSPTDPSSKAALKSFELFYRFPAEVQNGSPVFWMGPNTNNLLYLMAYAVDGDGIYQDVSGSASWFVSNAAIVRPNFTRGLFEITGTGTATFGATFQGFTRSVSATVFPGPRSYPYLKVSLDAWVGDFRSSTASLVSGPFESDRVVVPTSWTSSDSSIIAVDGQRITGRRPATADLTVTYNGNSTTYRVSVQPDKPGTAKPSNY